MARPPNWAELPGDLLASVAARLPTLACYAAARGVCAAWRSALPLSPFLLVASVRSGYALSLSLPSQSAFRLAKLKYDYRCVGAAHGWLAVAYGAGSNYETSNATSAVREYYYRNFEGERVLLRPDELPEVRRPGRPRSRIALLNPVTGKRVVLPEHARLDPSDAIKVAFAPNPGAGDFTAVVAFGWTSLAYVSTRDDGRAWSFGEIAGGGGGAIADVVYRAGGGDGDSDRVYILTRRGDVHVLHVPRSGRSRRLVLEPLLAPERGGGGERFDPADVFAPKHAWLSDRLTGAKNLAFCGSGDVYQVWRNNVATMRVSLEGGSSFAVSKDEVLVLRYDPSSQRQPCWKEVADLGGHAVLVGPANGAVSMRAEGVPGLKGNCVYWVGDGQAMVFDMRTKKSTPCLPLSSTAGRVPVCWYTLGGKIKQHGGLN